MKDVTIKDRRSGDDRRARVSSSAANAARGSAQQPYRFVPYDRRASDNAPPSPVRPSLTMLVKLGSIAVHADEMISPHGHNFDRIALQALLEDPDVIRWVKEMDRLAMLPKKRNTAKR